MVFRPGAKKREEVIEGFWHEIPGGAGIPAETLKTVDLQGTRTTTHGVVLLHHGDIPAVTGQECGGGKTCHTSADDNRCARCEVAGILAPAHADLFL